MIVIKTRPILNFDEEAWLNSLENDGLLLISITLHSVTNSKSYYFRYQSVENKKVDQ